VGEAARGGPHVESDPPRDLNLKPLQGVGELDPSPADVGVIGLLELQCGAGGDGGAGLRHGDAVHEDLPREDQPEGALPGRGQPPLDHEPVEPDSTPIR
jgi:hypothetical protein